MRSGVQGEPPAWISTAIWGGIGPGGLLMTHRLECNDVRSQVSAPSWSPRSFRVRTISRVFATAWSPYRSVPAALKNAIDVGSRPYGKSAWSGRPGAVVSASPGLIGGFGARRRWPASPPRRRRRTRARPGNGGAREPADDQALRPHQGAAYPGRGRAHPAVGASSGRPGARRSRSDRPTFIDGHRPRGSAVVADCYGALRKP